MLKEVSAELSCGVLSIDSNNKSLFLIKSGHTSILIKGGKVSWPGFSTIDNFYFVDVIGTLPVEAKQAEIYLLF